MARVQFNFGHCNTQAGFPPSSGNCTSCCGHGPSMLRESCAVVFIRDPRMPFRACRTAMSLMRDVRLLSSVSRFSVATEPSTLISIVVHSGRRSQTEIACSHRGIVELDPAAHWIKQASRAQGAPTKASRSSSQGKSAPEKSPRPRVTLRDDEAGEPLPPPLPPPPPPLRTPRGRLPASLLPASLFSWLWLLLRILIEATMEPAGSSPAELLGEQARK
mmetsp:Transcript_51925/g.134685  ORF Transcript_51925/g.134685 Transcript_51925/m.134685 type:complete len:218 (+) Transcript_51925:708-1361(+)